MGTARPGFDVNAAAARLRESLLPAGLRNRPPSMPAPTPAPEPAAEPEAAPAPAGESGLEAVWNAAPFAPLAEQPGLAADALFDPETLGSDAPAPEATWDPNAQPYDPSAQPYDPNAPQQWDANGQPWDPNAQPYDPNAQPYDPNAPQQWDANGQPWDPNAQPYDPNAPQQWDANGQPWDPNAQPYDPNAAQQWDPNAQPYDPNAPQQPEVGAQGWESADPNAAPQWDAAGQPAWDPGLTAQWGEQPAAASPDAPAEAGFAEPEWGTEASPAQPAAELPPEPMVETGGTGLAEPEWGAEAAQEPAAEAGATGFAEPEWNAEAAPEEAVAPEPAAWDASALPPEEQPESAVAFDSEEPALSEQVPEPAIAPPAEPAAEADAFDVSVEEPAESAPPAGEELLPFDASAVSAVGPDIVPEGWGAVEPTIDLAAPEGAFAAAPDDYGDLAGPEQPSQLDSLAPEDAMGLLAPLGAGQELTSDDDAFAQGFQLESNGSFGEAAAPAAPTWSAPPQAGEPEDWESAPSLDLASMAPPGGVPPLDLAPAAPSPHDALDEIEVEEIPIVEGSDLLEELPPEPAPKVAAPPPPPPPPAAPATAAPEPAEVRIDGMHRVVVHTVEGLVKRGVITDVTLDADTLPLAPQPDAAPERLPTGKVKAIFFMLAAGEKAPTAEGKKVRVTFNDGRQIAGFSPAYSDVGPGFFMIPADTRTNTGRIWVYRSAVKSVAVS
jgi:hypothetical protein